MLSEYLDLIEQDEILFKQALEKARKRNLVLSAPIVFTRACNASPLCYHCSWRPARTLMKRWHQVELSAEAAAARAALVNAAGIDRIYMVSGWMGDELPEYFYRNIQAIKKNTNVEISATFGPINNKNLARLKELGVGRVSCGIETSNPTIFSKFKPGDNFKARIRTLEKAKELGFKTSTNFIIGIGETKEDIANNLELAEKLGVDYVSVSALTPCPFTEMEKCERPAPYWVAKNVAAARVLLEKVKDISGSFGCDTITDMAWSIKSGGNAFATVLRNKADDVVFLGDELTRLRISWSDYHQK